MHRSITTHMTPTRKAEYKVLEKYVGRKAALKNFRKRYQTPFGSERGIRYTFDPATNLLTYAGAVWNYSEPQRPVSNKVMKALVDDNFERCPVIVKLPKTPTSMTELSKTIRKHACLYGMTTESQKYRILSKKYF